MDVRFWILTCQSQKRSRYRREGSSDQVMTRGWKTPTPLLEECKAIHDVKTNQVNYKVTQ